METTKEVTKHTPLEAAINETGITLEHLEKEIDELTAKLGPIMLPPPPQPEKEDKGEKCQSKVVRCIEVLRRRISTCTAKLEQTRERLEV